MLTKGRISLLIAAGGLLLVGLLAAALFVPGGEDAAPEAAPKKKETPVKMDVAVNPATSLPGSMGLPKVTPEATPTPAVSPTPAQPKAEPAREPAKPAIIEYKVQPGDMLAKIAKKYGCKLEDIYKLNEGLTPATANKIRVGQVIRVPNGPGAVVEAETEKPKAEAKGFPQRTVKAEAGDTAFSLAIEYYGSRSLFRMIVEANPNLPWSDRLKGGEEVLLPAWGEQVEAKPAAQPRKEEDKATVERDSIIPPRR
ncbi:MAG: hypothetical protein BroJett014_28150 [Planctomycetota bacterium]|nr:hypothetical protein [Planctomycetota bacterium]GIK53842.1 MAG: hypothetical protein BroJett014_28150 [Planctomycetota bacterium]